MMESYDEHRNDVTQRNLEELSPKDDAEYEINIDDLMKRRQIVEEVDHEFSKLERTYTLAFEDIHYKAKNKLVLKGIYGFAAPGEVTALMGPSGAGKSTLLNVLSARYIKNVTGRLSVNNIDVKHVPVKRLFAYVLQDDIFLSNLSVWDQIYYSALLRLPQKLSMETKKKRIAQIIELLGLKKCMNTRTDRVSGGERKRVNIAVEMVHNPAVILLDEPTSGLDSTTAFHLIKSLKELAREGHTIILTIHQPSYDIFKLLDKLILLVDGELVYFGSAMGVSDHFGTLGFPITSGDNPIDFVMDLVSGDRSMKREVLQKLKSLNIDAITQYQNALAKQYEKYDIQHPNELEWNSSESLPKDKIEYKWPTSLLYQFGVLFRRSIKHLLREYFSLFFIIQQLCITIICGLLWLRVPMDISYTHDRLGYIFFSTMYWIMQRVYLATISFPLEREVVTKERASGSYHLLAYFLAKDASEFCSIVVFPIVYTVVTYWMTNISPSPEVFIEFLIFIIIGVISGDSMGLAVSTTFKSTPTIMRLTTPLTLSMVLVGGFYILTLPAFISWYQYLSIFRAVSNILTTFVFTKSPPYYCDSTRYVPCTIGTFVPGEELLAPFNINSSLALNIPLIFILILAFQIIAFLNLKFIHRPQT
jgi:ABC-type multidrug transport system ATPase subunit